MQEDFNFFSWNLEISLEIPPFYCVMHGSILPVTIPLPGDLRIFISKMSILHPQANKESQFPTLGTTFTNHHCTQSRYKSKFYKCQPSNSLAGRIFLAMIYRHIIEHVRKKYFLKNSDAIWLGPKPLVCEHLYSHYSPPHGPPLSQTLNKIPHPGKCLRIVRMVTGRMDHLHYRLNFDLDKNFITAWKSITKLVIFQSFVAKCCKMRIK
jgi:hypothetical protein